MVSTTIYQQWWILGLTRCLLTLCIILSESDVWSVVVETELFGENTISLNWRPLTEITILVLPEDLHVPILRINTRRRRPTFTLVAHLPRIAHLLILFWWSGGAVTRVLPCKHDISPRRVISPKYTNSDGLIEIFPDSPRYIADGRPDLIVPSMEFQRTLSALQQSNDITLLATFQQDRESVGSIISLSDNDSVYLGLQVSSHKKEVRLKYVDTDGLPHTEYFEKMVTDDRVHKLAVSISGTDVQVFYDCHSISKRPMEGMPDRNFSASNMKLYVGQENLGNIFKFRVSWTRTRGVPMTWHYLTLKSLWQLTAGNIFQFQGNLEEVGIVVGPNGHLLQCPHLDSDCPTCGQFRHLQNTIELLQEQVYALSRRVSIWT